MSVRDYENYCELFSTMTTYLNKPDLIVYLRATTDTLLSRIRSRGREFEKSISPEYLHMLNIAYEHWINRVKNEQNILIVETDKINVFKDKKKLQDILDTIKEYCP